MIISQWKLSTRVPYFRRTWHIKSGLKSKANHLKLSSCWGYKRFLFNKKDLEPAFSKGLAAFQVIRWTQSWWMLLGASLIALKSSRNFFKCFSKSLTWSTCQGASYLKHRNKYSSSRSLVTTDLPHHVTYLGSDCSLNYHSSRRQHS